MSFTVTVTTSDEDSWIKFIREEVNCAANHAAEETYVVNGNSYVYVEFVNRRTTLLPAAYAEEIAENDVEIVAVTVDPAGFVNVPVAINGIS